MRLQFLLAFKGPALVFVSLNAFSSGSDAHKTQLPFRECAEPPRQHTRPLPLPSAHPTRNGSDVCAPPSERVPCVNAEVPGTQHVLDSVNKLPRSHRAAERENIN